MLALWARCHKVRCFTFDNSNLSGWNIWKRSLTQTKTLSLCWCGQCWQNLCMEWQSWGASCTRSVTHFRSISCWWGVHKVIKVSFFKIILFKINLRFFLKFLTHWDGVWWDAAFTSCQLSSPLSCLCCFLLLLSLLLVFTAHFFRYPQCSWSFLIIVKVLIKKGWFNFLVAKNIKEFLWEELLVFICWIRFQAWSCSWRRSWRRTRFWGRVCLQINNRWWFTLIRVFLTHWWFIVLRVYLSPWLSGWLPCSNSCFWFFCLMASLVDTKNSFIFCFTFFKSTGGQSALFHVLINSAESSWIDSFLFYPASFSSSRKSKISAWVGRRDMSLRLLFNASITYVLTSNCFRK